MSAREARLAAAGNNGNPGNPTGLGTALATVSVGAVKGACESEAVHAKELLSEVAEEMEEIGIVESRVKQIALIVG